MAGLQCCENPPTPTPNSGSGTVQEVGGLKAYISGSPHSKRGIVFISDVYGYEAPKLRKLADKAAAVGFYVVIPDVVRGDPYTPEDADRPLPVWLKSHEAGEATELAKPVLAALKSKDISAIGVAGFCWGAKVAVQLAKSNDIKAVVLLHPSFVTIDDINEVKVPIAVLGAEIDKISPPELVKQFDEVLTAKPEVDCHVRIFPGVTHGWTIRYKDEDEVVVKLAETAHRDMTDWFFKHVK